MDARGKPGVQVTLGLRLGGLAESVIEPREVVVGGGVFRIQLGGSRVPLALGVGDRDSLNCGIFEGCA